MQLLYKYRFMILFFIGGWEDMARKAYSEEDRVQVRNALMTTMIQCIADRGLIHSSIDVLCRKVEISKTFFYSFFSSKEELVLYALRYQQPKLLDYARSLMEDPGLSWRAGVETFLKTAVMELKAELPFCPLRRSSKYATAFPRRISRRSGGIRLFLWKAAFHLWPPCGQY